ncbi:MAG: aldose epimerase family protein [Bryobacteraceae bacterium]|jgi:aldose 1-epimerase
MLALSSVAVVLLVAGATTIYAATKISKADFGKTKDGAAVQIFTLTNASGMELKISTYGGAIVSLKTPGRTGAMGDVVLGFDSLDGYLNPKEPYFGALVGRYGNRIGHARFTLDGKTYTLPVNNGENSLHGGDRGFDKYVWTPKELSDGGLQLTILSPDGDQGYPGNLHVTVAYHLTAANEVKIDYSATTDKDTVVNLTNHAYYNLKGAGNGDILGHVMMLNASKFTPVDAGLIPTGELKPVAGTPFDFTKPTAIGARINQDDEQLKLGKGYDHNWVIDRKGASLSLAARVEEPTTGRVMEVLTTEPGIQFYTGNFLDGTLTGKGGKVYPMRAAFCLETQHYPDSPNQPGFPSTELKPGQTYKTTTVYRFSTKK